METVTLDLPRRLLALLIDQGDVQDAPAQFQGRFHRVGDPGALAGTGDQTIDDHFHLVRR